MDSLYLLRERIEELYAEYSRIVDKAVQFVVTFIAFYLINANIGFMEAAANPVITVALSVICTFFKPAWTLLVAALLILAHMYELSLGVLAVVALVFFVMYVFFIRMTPGMALVVLLTPILFHFHIPFVLPVACGLISSPVSMVAIACGTVTYYMLDYVKVAEATLRVDSFSEMMDQMTMVIQQIFTGREMWIYVLTFMICVLVVYAIRRMSVDHAWIIAIAAGVVANIVVIAGGDIALGVATSYGSLFIGNVIAAVVGLILNFFFFSVDYARSENLQYEDDDYYYYVKAVPKLSVARTDVTVTRINARKEQDIPEDDEDEENPEKTPAGRSRRESEEEAPKKSGSRSSGSGTGSTARHRSGGTRNSGTGSSVSGSGSRTRSSGSAASGRGSASSGHRSTGSGAGKSRAARNGSEESTGRAHSQPDDTPEVEDVNQTLLDMSLREDLKM